MLFFSLSQTHTENIEGWESNTINNSGTITLCLIFTQLYAHLLAFDYNIETK